MEAGKPVVVEVGSTLADGLAVPMVGFNSFETAKNLVDKMVRLLYLQIASCEQPLKTLQTVPTVLKIKHFR